MAFTFTSTQAGASADYKKYLGDNPVKTDRVNDPDLFDFSLIPWDAGFVKLVRGAYITFNTNTYAKWFTGYVTNDPQLEFLGSSRVAGVKKPIYGYRYQATDDAYVLNMKPIGLLPPFINSTCGDIIKALVRLLDPSSTFTTTGVQNGIRLARYTIEPNKKFSEVVKELCDLSAFRFRAWDKTLVFEARDTTVATLTIDGNVKHFTPSRLSLKPTVDPVVNDVIVVGGVEPQSYINEWFVGDGFSAQFPLLSGIFGVDSTVLLDEDFGGSQINGQSWNIFDTASVWLKALSGYLNVLGGSNNGSWDVYLQTARLVPLEGQLRLTHGQFDFVDAASVGTNGMVAGLWTQAPNSAYTGCVYGIEVSKSGSVTTIKPVVNGVVDGTQSLTVDFTKRYVLRTLCSFERTNRQQTAFAYTTQAGATGSYGGGTVADAVTYKTWIVAIDPSNGSVASTTEWKNADVSIASATTYANYVPVASNDLHCTVTGITISTPMLANLEVKASGASVYEKKLVGPNEIDSLDGLAPIATVVTDGAGFNSLGSNIGAPKYNPGNATLTFFKDTTKQVSYIPQVKDIAHLSYRRAGVSVGRVQNPANIASEASVWGDNGVRSLTRSDLAPAPRNSSECELAAAAIIQESGFQHYEGSYTQYHTAEFTGQPLSGTILKFQNLPTQLPTSLQAEVINEVKSTMLSGVQRELFSHVVSFGKQQRVARALSQLADAGKGDAVLGALDAVDSPLPVILASVGSTFIEDVTAPTLVSVGASDINFDAGQAIPSGGGFEIRYTDDSWGADAGRNLVSRVATTAFSVPRTARGKICFIKAYDARNKVLYSEDLTNAVWIKGVNTSVANVSVANPEGNTAMLSEITWSGTGNRHVYQDSAIAAAGKQCVTVVYIKGTAGTPVQIYLSTSTGTDTAFVNTTLNGSWQKVTVSTTYGGGVTGNIRVIIQNPTNDTPKVKIGRVSLEVDRLTETGYFKTVATTFGAMSRYAAGLRVNFPLVPPAPTASLAYTDPVNPVVTVTLPGALQDVWGVEIRASDNSTVLYHKDLSDSGYSPAFTHAGNASRSLSYYVYTYNLLGEFSTAYNATATIPTPSLSALSVDETAEVLKWTGANATKYQVEIATDAGYTAKTLDKETTGQFIALDEDSLLLQRYFRVTPKDSFGSGTPVTTSHVVNLNAPGSLDATGSGAGVFVFKWSQPASSIKPAALLYKVTIASDSGFTANVETFSDIQAYVLTVRRANVTRFWKVEARYAGGSYGTAAIYGSPTAVASGLVVVGTDTSGNLDDLPEGTTYKRLGAASVDAFARPLVDFSLGAHTNKTADYIAEAATRKWAGESGADVTGSHTAADTSAVAGLAAARVPEVIVSSGGVGKLKPVKFVDANPGAVTGAKLLVSGVTSDETNAWIALSTVDIDVPAGVASLIIQLTASLSGSGTQTYGSSPPFGASIHTGSPPATPQVTRATTPGPVTFTNPVGNKLTIYAKGTSGGTSFELTLNATQDVTIPLRTGSVT